MAAPRGETGLESLLAFSYSGAPSMVPPRDSHILVTDTQDAPGAFVLVQYALAALQPPLEADAAGQGDAQGRAKGARRIVWVGCEADGPQHWTSIMRRLGVSQSAFARSWDYVGVDGGDGDVLEMLRRSICTVLSAEKDDTRMDAPSADTLVVVDSISALQWVTPGTADEVSHRVLCWTQAVRRICREVRRSVVPLR
ncbi:hypothetical protein MSPP1_002660 [Malassezia sp. CBS 17886]|nr:hypothetical protein MSPP1_002660 [Malassezia sp. CBS 17886]